VFRLEAHELGARSILMRAERCEHGACLLSQLGTALLLLAQRDAHLLEEGLLMRDAIIGTHM